MNVKNKILLKEGVNKVGSNKDILIKITLMWAEQYEEGNKEACDMLLGYYKKELGIS